jgi:c-di-GMP-binding flagellar brake protein YcgR
MPPQRRFSMRVATDMPVVWCTVADDGRAGAAATGTCVDISSSGVAFLSESVAQVRDGILVQLEHELLAAALAVPARIVRVTRAPGGYRLAAAFESLDAPRRAMLGRFVIALMRARAA